MLSLQVLSLVLWASACFAGSFSSQYVKSLTGNSFKKDVLGTSRATVAAFYAPWCGHCQRLAPEYEKAAKNLAGLVDFVAVNCDEDQNKGLCSEYGVKGFPTLKIFGGFNKAEAKDYQGERTASALVQHATREISSFTKRVKSEVELSKLISKVPKKPLVFLFTDKIAPPAMFKALSAEWQSSFSFYTIKDEEQFAELKQVFGIKKIPSLLLWKGEESVEVYAGTLKIGHINHWLKQAVKSGTAKSEL